MLVAIAAKMNVVRPRDARAAKRVGLLTRDALPFTVFLPSFGSQQLRTIRDAERLT